MEELTTIDHSYDPEDNSLEIGLSDGNTLEFAEGSLFVQDVVANTPAMEKAPAGEDFDCGGVIITIGENGTIKVGDVEGINKPDFLGFVESIYEDEDLD